MSRNEGARAPGRMGRPKAGLSRGGALKTLKTERAVQYRTKINPLRSLCGGRLHRWLALWVLGREQGSTPWPGWQAWRVILERVAPENVVSPVAERVTTDTIMCQE